MTNSQIYERLTAIFDNVFDMDDIVLRPDMTAKDVDGWDSLAHIRLIITIEKEFKTKFSASEVGKLETVGDLVELIVSHVLRVPERI